MQEEILSRLVNTCNFETIISRDVYWVPFNMFGEAKLPLEEILELKELTPREKKNRILTIMDLITLFIISDFEQTDDSIHIIEGRIDWEHYKQGEKSVHTNCGCCASCCSWANYFLKEMFDDTGILGIIRPKGGHAINYFYSEGWFYFLDMQTLVKPFRYSICQQTGKREDFVKSRFITGVLIKAKSLEAFTNYHSRYLKRSIPEHIYIDERLNNACPIGTDIFCEKRKIYLPDSNKIIVINPPAESSLFRCEYIEFPKILPDWES